MRTLIRAALLAASVVTVAAPVHAQETVTDAVTFLLTNQAVVTADFERDRAAATAARDTIARALLVNLTTMPLSTSSSGFLYRFNPDIGTVERATESFGSFFVERALTAGRGHASFGVSATTSSFNRLDGQNLRDGSLVTVANRFRDEAAPFDIDSLTLDIRSSTMTLFASLGVTDRLEIGGAVPLLRLTLDGRRDNVYRTEQFVQATAVATASGIGDVALRGKYALFIGREGGIAVAAELRLPTGDEANLLGAGSRSYRVLGIGSVDRGRLALNGNMGIVRGGISAEFTFAGSAAVAVSPHVTLSGELLGRHVAELREMTLVSAAHPSFSGVDTLRLVAGETGTTIVNAVTGVKWNLGRTVVMAGHLTWPLTHVGLTAVVTPTLAFEYAF
jgi:hypothetical protein